MPKKGSRMVMRDAQTGRFVKKGEAKRRPSTPDPETIKTPRKKRR